MSKVTILGKDFEVTDDVVAAIKERELAFDSKLQENGKELGELRKVKEELDRTALQAESQGLYDFYADPVGSVKRFESSIEKKLEEKLQSRETKLTEKIEAASAVREFWRDFYANNPELRKNKQMVEAITQENLEELKKCANADTAESFIKAKILLKLSALKGVAASGERPMFVESGEFVDIKSNTVNIKQPVSLASKINERRAAKLGG